ncbi:MAG: endonuclease V [Gemmatimonadota bacterium]|nr:MAG: endonuclease V [Gemmatimonadota bacterium]
MRGTQVISVAEARDIQIQLRERVVFERPLGFEPRLVAGADVAFDKARNMAFGAIVVMDLETMEDVESVTAAEPISFPYVPGYLSFRELPALTAAWRLLRKRPDCAVLDAHGYAHPRRLGLASHAGLELGVPTVGCAKSLLCGKHDQLPEQRGAHVPLTDPTSGEVIGLVLRTRDRVRPVYVSVGHLIDLPTAADLILRLTPEGRYRFPETTRRADRLAAEAKRAG